MKSIERNFGKEVVEFPEVSTYMCFARAVNGGGYVRSVIQKWFNKLVEKGDYANSEKRAIIDHLEYLSFSK